MMVMHEQKGKAKPTPTTKPDTDAGTIQRGRRDKPVRMGVAVVVPHKQDEGKGRRKQDWWGPHRSTKLLWLRPYDGIALVDLTCRLWPMYINTNTLALSTT